MRLIDGDRLWEVLCNYMPLSQEDIDFISDHLPVVDAISERKKGKWIHNNTSKKSEKWICSECGKTAYYPHTAQMNYKICPYCGADMRGEVDD